MGGSRGLAQTPCDAGLAVSRFRLFNRLEYSENKTCVQLSFYLPALSSSIKGKTV